MIAGMPVTLENGEGLQLREKIFEDRLADPLLHVDARLADLDALAE